MATILRRNLISVTEGPVTLLDASYHSQNTDRVILYFSKTTDIDQVHINPPWRVVDRISVDGAWTLHLEHGEDAPVSLVLFGAHHQLKPAHTELDIIAGKNAFLAVRNKEGADIVANWFEFHAQTQNAESAVIFDRALPDETDTFAKRLNKQLSNYPNAQIVIVSSNVPFGDPNLPAEQHPYCVPTAPGKDRMDIPDPDPQHAPLHEVHLFEILRNRFLDQAHAVANIDVYDLILPTQAPSVFDLAQDASQGVITLAGQMCFLEMGLFIGGPEHGVDKDRVTTDLPSIKMWLEYFPKSHIHGLGISDFSWYKDDRFTFVRCDMDTRENIEMATGDLPEMDIILDDASHASYHQQNAFLELFPKLKPGGLYIIEDLRWQPSMMEKEGITKTADLFAGFSKSQKFSHIDKDVEAELNALAPHISGCFVFQAQFDKKKRDQVAVIHKR